MDLNWLQSILYGIVAGLTDVLPVSAQAHEVLLMKFWGIQEHMEFVNFLTHLAVIAALYFSSQTQLIRISRARALARIPKRKRRRPLDTRSLMDFSLLKTMLVPVVIGLFLYRFASRWNSSLPVIAAFLALNGVILYAPQFLPGSNRDSRTLSRVEGLLMGLGGMASVLPGISAVGMATSIGSICGVERSYSLNMALLMKLFLTAGMLVYDGMAIASNGIGTLSFLILLRCLLTMLAAFIACVLGVKFLRYLAARHSFALFGLYCFGLSLFTFILNLMA